MQMQLKEFLDQKVEEYNQPFFIEKDPICIPHMFTKKQDIEIAGFFAAIFAWGNRTTIINKSKVLLQLMDQSPYEFCLHHSNKELKKLIGFSHRTFNDTDLLYFIEFFKSHYQSNDSLESAFSKNIQTSDKTIENALIGFYRYFFSLPDVPSRTTKHISSPEKKSACKKICMFLRWMIRNDHKGVDFGLWSSIKPSQLVIPLDVHVTRIAKKLRLTDRKQSDWQTALELTAQLRSFDDLDPVKYDFALFTLGVEEKW